MGAEEVSLDTEGTAEELEAEKISAVAPRAPKARKPRRRRV